MSGKKGDVSWDVSDPKGRPSKAKAAGLEHGCPRKCLLGLKDPVESARQHHRENRKKQSRPARGGFAV